MEPLLIINKTNVCAATFDKDLPKIEGSLSKTITDMTVGIDKIRGVYDRLFL